MTWLALREELALEFSALPRFRLVSGFGVTSPRPAYDPAEYRQRRAVGLCAHCSQLAEPGRSTCVPHRSRAVRGRYPGWVAAGLCGACGGQPAPGKSRCAKCREADRVRTNARRAKRRQKRADLVVGVEGAE